MRNHRFLHHKKPHDDMRLPPNQRPPYRGDQVGIPKPSAQSKPPQNLGPLHQKNSHGAKRLPPIHKQSLGNNWAENQPSKKTESYKQPDHGNRESSEPRKGESQPKNLRPPHNKYKHGDAQLTDRDVNRRQPFEHRPSRDLMRYSRHICQQQNMNQVSRAPTTRFGQSHVPLASGRVVKGISNTTDSSSA